MTHDNKNLLLQFKVNIYSKNGTEFQSFFESIMEKAYPDFQKIRPYGAEGDSGNDGYRKSSGIYYQVYAPIDPKTNEKEASVKFEKDFIKLQEGWSDVAEIKEYNFVFNDKYLGSVKSLELVITKLSIDNPNIKFQLLLPIQLEKIFISLEESDILDLGFNIDSRQTRDLIKRYLTYINNELDKENPYVTKIFLGDIRDIIFEENDDGITLSYEILECRYLQKTEEVDEAKIRYENLSKRYPHDSRPLLYLAEIFLSEKNYERNQSLLLDAEKIDSTFWLLILEKLVRKMHLGEKIERDEIESISLPDEPKIKANYYRLFALIFDNLGDESEADSYFEKAIHLNPDRFSNYVTKLVLLRNRIIRNFDSPLRQQYSQKIIEEINNIQIKFCTNSDIGPRQQALLNSFKLFALSNLEEIYDYEKLASDTFPILLHCHFDKEIEQFLIELLSCIILPNNEFLQLQKYLRNSEFEISDEFSKILIGQFDLHKTLLTEGKQFYKDIRKTSFSDFITDIENRNDQMAISFLFDNIKVLPLLINTLKEFPELRKNILENLPNEYDTLKIKLSLLLTYDEKDSDEAFEIIKQLDLTQLNYVECRMILQVIQNKHAWDFEVIILEKLINKEKDENIKFNLKLQLFIAMQNLTKSTEVMTLGEQLLKEDKENKFLSPNNKQALLENTIYACFERGKIDNIAQKKAMDILSLYPLENPPFEFLVGTEAEVFLRNNEPHQALSSIICAVKTKEVLSPEEYARLFFVLDIRIAKQIGLDISSNVTIEENSYIKMLGKERWYFVGEENELDAIPIGISNERHSALLGKNLHDKIIFQKKYGSVTEEEQIELIFPIEKYIFWQSIHHFQELSKRDALEGVQSIEMPGNSEEIDLRYLLQFFEDLQKPREPFFDIYCQKVLPLAFLAINEGSLINAIGRIKQENKGFIHISAGPRDEFNQQLEVAKKVIANSEPFYIDGTSALFLSETGLMTKIQKHIPNIKVPQSVISFLIDVTSRFQYSPDQAGFIGFAQGKIFTYSLEKDIQDSLRDKFISSITFLESNHNNIGIISKANKVDCFSELKVPPEICDACILAQKEEIPILTEDFLYLQMNEFETKKKSPKYFSSLLLLRALYELKKISFEEYLDFLGYLAFYRCRFIPINVSDIELAVFGSGEIKVLKPENIRIFNFPITLSEEYGVTFQSAATVIGLFFTKVLFDTSINEEIAEKIFIEILETFPTKLTKKEFGILLLRTCFGAIEKIRTQSIITPGFQIIQRKFEKLLQTIEIFNSEARILIPK